MILIAILLGLIVLVFGNQNNQTPQSCNISEFLKKRKNKGSCPPDGNLNPSNFCKVPCDTPTGDVTISCSSDGKTGVVRRCDDTSS